jgi:hypothetical protein
MTYVKEYDLEFKLANIMKFQGLCKMEIEALNYGYLLEDSREEELLLSMQQSHYVPTLDDSWYNDLK